LWGGSHILLLPGNSGIHHKAGSILEDSMAVDVFSTQQPWLTHTNLFEKDINNIGGRRGSNWKDKQP